MKSTKAMFPENRYQNDVGYKATEELIDHMIENSDLMDIVTTKLALATSQDQGTFFDQFFIKLFKACGGYAKEDYQLLEISKCIGPAAAESMQRLHDFWDSGVNGPQDT